MSNENFFKHDDKAYAENLNDAILIANAFDYEVPVNIPSMYSNHHYPSNNNTYKAGVADITLISSGSLSIGDEAITNNTNSSQMLRLRIYPNFNNFYAWKRLNWTCTGAVTVNICDAGTSTSLLPSGALTNPDNETLLNGISSLQGLKEYDLLITIPVNGVLNTLSLVFVNNWNSQNRVSASISQGNVTGLVSDLSSLESGKADTEHTHSSSDVTESNALSNIGTSANATQSVINGAVDEMVGSLDTSITNIMGFTLVHSGASDKIRVYSNGLVVYFTMQGTFSMNANADTNTGTIPSQYAPNVPITVATHPSNNNKLVIQETGSLVYHNFTTTTTQLLRVGVVYPLKAKLP